MRRHHSFRWRMAAPVLATCCLLMISPVALHAGGPLFVGGPTFGVDGQPFTWNPATMPIKYRVDGGPMSVAPSGQVVISNAQGITRVQQMLQTWQNVSTAAVSFSNAGPILPVAGFSDGDVSSAPEFAAVAGSCQSGAQSPIIFDANGRVLAELGADPLIIGFSGQCALSKSGQIISDLVLLNGAFQDGVTQPQLDANQFNEAIIHEMGHFLGLDHSQINLDLFLNALNAGQFGTCDLDDLAGLPLMFPISFCQARLDAGLPQLAPDDMAWISKLYPSTNFAKTYATISGTIFSSDGQTPVQGVNVIARQLDDSATSKDESRRVAMSVVSGYRFTQNPGQTVTSNYLPCTPPGQRGCPVGGFLDDNSAGDVFGSRNSSFIGSYDIPVLAGASYTVEVESVFGAFIGGSGVGPLRLPIALPGGIPEFWHQTETSFDDPTQADPISTSPGQTIPGTDVILNGTQPTFDRFEDPGANLLRHDLVPMPREDELQQREDT